MKKNYFAFLLLLPTLLIAQTTFTSAITPDLSAYGEATNYPGEGEYQMFLSPDAILDKPIILVDGFDTGDTRTINGIYNLLDFAGTSGTENLADQLRALGFDIIILNFPVYTRSADAAIIDGGTDFMERNAMLLVELLNIVNTAKASNSPEQNVIIGPSMGGLISRYALNYMEANALDADTRLYISFDAPHHGANVPIGLQHQLNYLAFNDLNPVPEVQSIITTLLNSPASRQLLIDHFESHLVSGSLVDFDPNLTLPEPHPFRTQFESNINGLVTGGFPQNTRNVAIINGSGIGNPYFAIGDSGTIVTNGFPIVSTVLPVTVPSPFGDVTINVEIDINMTPAAGASQQVSRFFAPIPIFPDVEAIANSGTTNFDGVDSAPGGLFDISALTGGISGGGGIGADFLAALQIDKFSYIPSVSALALDITEEATGDDINWHHDIDIAGRSTTNDTPFANTFLPDDNEPHVQLTAANVAFALNEILNPPLSVSNNEFFTVQLEKNPVIDELILSSNAHTNVNISISDLTGKMVYKSNADLNTRTIIPLNLTSGFYILNVKGDNNETFTTKFIVNK
ncbi:T9SS type A sorting domain-containing protein [Winogradskyella schleiferi]|uniref:T9SS type A sorting domain-containing protein n=1 Tax=Winogradskyella schleiferi TaxID=2686078 RepID=UPI0015C16EA3|nr:T9SS type A sorting domain-containing protein [Winogradskyella schleiferi]